MLGMLEETASEEALTCVVKAPFPMRFAQDGLRSRFPPSPTTEARVLSVPQQAGPDRDPDPEKDNLGLQDQFGTAKIRTTPTKKPLCCNLPKRKKEQIELKHRLPQAR